MSRDEEDRLRRAISRGAGIATVRRLIEVMELKERLDSLHAHLPLARRIAKAFCEEIQEQLTAREIREVNRRNLEYSPGTCATHDFCDANMPMLSAFVKVVGRDVDLESDFDTRLWGRAWDIAKEAEFDPDEVSVGDAEVEDRDHERP